ncbi:hypothetical protein [Rhodopila sp.]|uniref:hypothetical protein n=1 Tax=Rhodopila sp. TaxID=2480087 RepID=UPI003D14603F
MNRSAESFRAKCAINSKDTIEVFAESGRGVSFRIKIGGKDARTVRVGENEANILADYLFDMGFAGTARTERPSDDIARTERPSDDIARTERPSDDIARTERPSDDIARTERPSDDIARTERPSDDIARTERPSDDIARTERPSDDAA